MAIPSVMQGLIETEGGKVFELDSPKGAAWLESIGSFRFEPAGDGKPYTVRREASGYWYGCRKVAGKVRKKYIGKSSEVNTAKLEEIAAALEVPPAQRVNKVVEEVAQVAQVAQVAEVTQDRLIALELEVANLRKALEALQEALPGKLESGDSTELPKVADEVADEVAEELQNELGNLKTENENLRRNLENSDRLVSRKNQEISELNSRLAAANKKVADSDEELNEQSEKLQRQDAEIKNLKSELARLAGENSEKSAAASNLPEAADLLNQLKARRKKSTATLADIEAILEMIE
jgi:chromosome segregation ATPase